MIYIPAKELHDIWPKIAVGLRKIVEKNNPDWIPEDVYSELRADRASLYLFDNDEGFTVLRINQSFRGAVLFIWCFYSPTFTNAPEKYWPEIQQIARNAGAVTVQFSAPRKGWGKMFKYTTSIYEGAL